MGLYYKQMLTDLIEEMVAGHHFQNPGVGLTATNLVPRTGKKLVQGTKFVAVWETGVGEHAPVV